MENQPSISTAPISCDSHDVSERHHNIDDSMSKGVGGSAEAEAAPANDEVKKTLLGMNGLDSLDALLQLEADLRRQRKKRKSRSNKRKKNQIRCDHPRQRKARYFDPPGEAMNSVVHFINFTARKQKKACYTCGSLEHSGKKCPKLRFCRLCGERGHLARDCSEKDKGSDPTSIICFKCGNPGHDLFHCTGSYSPDDLKCSDFSVCMSFEQLCCAKGFCNVEKQLVCQPIRLSQTENIRCYICMEVGHLCCAEPVEMRPEEVSCYSCGMHDHAGENCMKLRGGDLSGPGPPRLCYKCGEEGHLARKCAKRRKGRNIRGAPMDTGCITVDMVTEK